MDTHSSAAYARFALGTKVRYFPAPISGWFRLNTGHIVIGNAVTPLCSFQIVGFNRPEVSVKRFLGIAEEIPLILFWAWLGFLSG